MFCYGVGILPLAEKMLAAIPEALQPWYADDAASVGPAIHNARVMKYLVDHGPAYGYFPNVSKSIYICKGEDEQTARSAFDEFNLNVKFVRGHRYLGSYLGCRTLKEDYDVQAKVDTWTSAASRLALIAVKYLQSVYIGYTFCLQSE